MASESEEESLLSSSESEFLSSSETESDSDEEQLSKVRDWCKIDTSKTQPVPPKFPFSACPGLKMTIKDANDPLQFLLLFIDDEVVNIVVEETNRYASQNYAEASGEMVLDSKTNNKHSIYRQNNDREAIQSPYEVLTF
ncbi:piggyBac transposable element-derived protein 1-like [Stegodyphus dumicola]|uniref:piggyBac transposable element-derived protein 1-like n=1 Tax=Stegodyphus dumicola TaxID=202533 RepID=UPI0015A8D4BC|nr:piggyBac transposable element-derived protein 1-like [Stegodyphus dumicola]